MDTRIMVLVFWEVHPAIKQILVKVDRRRNKII